MIHSDIRKSMADYLEGDLSLHRRALFDAHLDECAGCAREIAQMRRTIAALRGLPQPEPPPDFVDDVMRRIRQGDAEPSFWQRAREIAAALFEPRVLAPVSAAMLVVGLLLGTGQVREVLEENSLLGVDGRLALFPASPDAHEAGVPGLGLERGQPRAYTWVAPNESVELTALGGAEPAPPSRTAGQELIALSERLSALSSRESRFSDWPPVRSMPPASAPAPSLSVGTRAGGSPRIAELPGGSSMAPGYPGDAAQRLPTADEWLTHLQRNPAEFADRLASRTLAEHEHWVESLARRAVEQGRLDQVIMALRSSGSRTARVLADDFAATGARIGGTVVTRRSD